MNIITWNCSGALRNKKELLNQYDYDVLVVQECEDPSKSINSYQNWANNYLWIGNNKNKGLGVFARKNITLKKLKWTDKNTNFKSEQLELFLPILINDEIILLAVWTKKANSEAFKYIGQLWKYIQLHKKKLMNKKVIILGDFNSNTKWDEFDRWWNHTDVVNELSQIDIKSVYHHVYNEEQGKETNPTFYLYRDYMKPYHIDYVFLSSNLIRKKEKLELIIGKKDEWLQYSYHMPLFFKF